MYTIMSVAMEIHGHSNNLRTTHKLYYYIHVVMETVNFVYMYVYCMWYTYLCLLTVFVIKVKVETNGVTSIE